MENIRKRFAQPPLEYRGAPFWSWNDRLQVNELVCQVNDMKEHGMGGFFMHSREGLETVYMGEEWMEAIRETVRAARETGMNAWLYDEDRWPSGFAGGLVPARGGDAFRAKVVSLEETVTVPEDAEHVLVLFAAEVENGTIRTCRRLPSHDIQPGTGEVLLVFRREISSASEWFNDDAYSDNMNPESVAAFLDITYEGYKKEVGDEFGKAIPGIFTDEPNIISHHSAKTGRRVLPWTDGLLGLFSERRGYDLLDVLPWLFYDGEKADKVRHDYWFSISQRFTEAFSRQVGEWCEKNGLAFTGHFLYEQEMGNGILTGGAIMPHYRYQQVPGIDMLTEQNREFLTIKQCSSVANQFGRSRVLSETYGCSGWEFTFEGQKWNGDWQYVLGVNLRAQHLALYSLRGCRKRDYPPAFNYNTTWWKYNNVVEDYFARIGQVLSKGAAVRDVLVIHPVATGWMMQGEGDASRLAVNEYAERLNVFTQALLATHYDFDFGDEQIMAEAARTVNGGIQVGEQRYSLVVVPPETRTLLASTVSLLEEYLSQGGTVIGFDPLPDRIEGLPDERLSDLWQQAEVIQLASPHQLCAALEKMVPRRVSLRNPYGQEAPRLLFMQRSFDGKFAYFIVNNDRSSSIQVEVMLEGTGRLEEWNPLTGEMCPVKALERDGRLYFNTYFRPAGSRLYIVDPSASPSTDAGDGFAQPETPQLRGTNNVQYIGPECAFTRTDPNLLTLDKCQYRLHGSEWSEEMDVWRAQDAVRRALGMRSNYYNGLPQRYRWALDGHPQDGAPVDFLFTFNVQDVPAAQVSLLLERAEEFVIKLNGVVVPTQVDGWYLDRSMKKVSLSRLRPGENELILSCAYTNSMEFEDCFIIGDFAVSLNRVIISEPERLHFGDWTAQGYPHYAGSMRYSGKIICQEGKSVRIFLGDHSAVDVAIFINGQLAGHIPWQSANGLDVTPYVQPGENKVEIEVVSSPRNMLGPLHRLPEHEPWTDWRSFRRTDASYTPDYVLWPWGLYGLVRVIEEEVEGVGDDLA